MPSSKLAPGTSVPLEHPKNSALATLVNLDRYMAASGHDVDHPWRKDIATALGARSPDEDAIDIVDNIVLTIATLDDLLRLALQACVEVETDGKVSAAIRAARRYGDDVIEHCHHIIGRNA